MSTCLIFCLLAAAVTSAVGVNFGECPAPDTANATKPVPRCGSVLTTDNGEIAYTPSSETPQNERCVWIIAASHARAYDITIENIDEGINKDSGSQFLVITDDTFTTFLPTCNSYDQIWSRALVVIFATSENAAASTGFKLSYKVNARENLYRDYDFADKFQLLAHPVYRKEYILRARDMKHALAMFVLPLPNNVYTGIKRRLFYRGLGKHGRSCTILLNVRKFNFTADSSSDKWWSREETRCKETEHYQDFHTDIIVARFISEHEVLDKPSWLQYI